MVELCKYCGSSVAESDVSVTRFCCESYVNGGEWTQSPDCMAEELRTLRALRDKVEAAPVWYADPERDGEPITMVWKVAGRPYLAVKLVPVEDVT